MGKKNIQFLFQKYPRVHKTIRNQKQAISPHCESVVCGSRDNGRCTMHFLDRDFCTFAVGSNCSFVKLNEFQLQTHWEFTKSCATSKKKKEKKL